MRFLYSLLFTLSLPLIIVRLWWRGRKVPGYRKRWRERFGLEPTVKKDKPYIWIHTVSVGEFIAARPLLDKLLALDDYNLAITTTTPTGSERVTETYGSDVYHCYLPYDLAFCLSPFFNKLHPALAIFLETELWPNTLAACSKRNIPTLLANGRLSEKSARGYAKFSLLTKPMLDKLNFAAIQHIDDANRFKALGLAENKIAITGSIKFDIAISHSQKQNAQALKRQLAGKESAPIWIAASTHKGEDEIILEAFKTARAKIKNLKLLLVPRHPDRFNQVYKLCSASGFKTLQRSETKTLPSHQALADYDIMLGDTMGEMMLLFGCADIAFVGGSLVDTGGHNTIEPAVWQLPIITGPSRFNFTDVSRQLIDAGAQTIVSNTSELSDAVIALTNTPQGKNSGIKAAEVATLNQGALQRLLGHISAQLQTK